MNKTNSKRHKKVGVNLTSSFWHLNSTSSLERPKHPFFFSPLVLWVFTSNSLARLRTPLPRGYKGAICSSSTFPMLPSSTAWRTIPRNRWRLKINYLHFLILFTNVITIYLQLWASKTTWKERTNAAPSIIMRWHGDYHELLADGGRWG